jgi:hypothetical protein
MWLTWQPTVAEIDHPVLLVLGTTIQQLKDLGQLRRDWSLSLAKNNQVLRKCINGFQWSMSTTTGTDQTFTATLPSLTWTWTKASTTDWEVIGWHIGPVILHRVVTRWPASTTSGRATRHLNYTSLPNCGIGAVQCHLPCALILLGRQPRVTF